MARATNANPAAIDADLLIIRAPDYLLPVDSGAALPSHRLFLSLLPRTAPSLLLGFLL